MENEVDNTVFSSHNGSDALTEEQIKCLIEIAIDRKFEELAKKLTN